jgi:2-(1,2-epoxy-1,2-dihydrophenyl)acetyl-CoA isomerase
VREIQYEVRDRVAWLRINRPEARNACSVAMLMEMQDRIYAAQVDAGVHTLIISGNGDNLTAGFDLKEVPVDDGPDAIKMHFRRTSLYWHSIMHSLVRLGKPVVVGAQGLNIAAAIGLIGVGDIAIISEDCRVSPAWISIGICPDASSTYHLPRIIGLRRAIEWIMTNHVADAQEMLDWGFVTRVVPRAELESALWQKAQELTRVPAELLGQTKFLMHHGTTATIENQTEWEREGVLASVGSDFMIERLREFLGKSKPSVREVTD